MTHPTPITAVPLPTIGQVGPAGADVVLYTTSVNSAIALQTLASLRDFAEQQCWSVAHEAYDLAPILIPARRRTGCLHRGSHPGWPPATFGWPGPARSGRP
ncbi:hypothetical protein O3S80_12030 [Streptomyces sp. Lzd4kr]|nr:hypothetical protein [Streptomyces sp. Lzd4kr]